MKKFCVLFVVLLMLISYKAVCEESDWAQAPVISKAYEISSGKVYIEWQGNAPLYQVNVDGKTVSTSNVNNTVLSVKKGTHAILVYPINDIKNADTNLNLDINFIKFGGSIGIDLAALGLDPKKLIDGNPSKVLNIDYSVDPLFSSTPEEMSFDTDPNNRVLLSFFDPFNSDEYHITISYGKNSTIVKYSTSSEDTESLISKNNSIVTLTLDQAFLEAQECIIPQIGSKYTFNVQFRKYAKNYLNGEKETSVIHESNISKKIDYIPIASWKKAPQITYASQTADGQVTVNWEHDSCGIDCEYVVKQATKQLGVISKDIELGKTSDTSIVIDDLMNGSYTIKVTPTYNGETGNPSAEEVVEVNNEWVVSPSLKCEQSDNNCIMLSWNAAESVDNYHITVYKSDDRSLLRYVNMNFNKCAEFDVESTSDDMEFLFEYGDYIEPGCVAKLKFEIYGNHHTSDGKNQKSSKSSCTIEVENAD